MKIVNTTDKAFSGMYDGREYGPFKTGEVHEFPDHVAIHLIQQSNILDDIGNVEGYRLATVDDAKQAGMKDIYVYECPLVSSGECQAKPFKSLDDLRSHMETHWAADAQKNDLLSQAEVASSKPNQSQRK